MEIVNTGNASSEAWDGFCDSSGSAWFWHRRAWIDYTLAYGSDRFRSDHSFMVEEGGRLVAAASVFLEERVHGGQPYLALGFGGGSWWAPAVAAGLDTDARAEILDLVLGRIEELAGELGAAYSSVKAGPLSHPWGDLTRELVVATTKRGWSDRSTLTRVVDLTRSPSELRGEMSKGHRAAITRAERLFTVEIVDHDNLDPELFESYRQMHRLAAGRETRPKRTFDFMFEWISQGSALLLVALDGGAPVGFAYVIVYRGRAYYASAANDPQRSRQPIGHALQAAALCRLPKMKVQIYELGEQLLGPLPYLVPSPKEVNIARFKRGFGGRTVPQLERERWWDLSLYRTVADARAEDYTGEP